MAKSALLPSGATESLANDEQDSHSLTPKVLENKAPLDEASLFSNQLRRTKTNKTNN